jgi:hypothetical protein
MSLGSPARIAARILAGMLVSAAAFSVSLADSGDTLWVRTFDHDFYNWATPHEQTFAFPDTSVHFSKVLLRYTIGCPGSPGDCDPWDRLGYLRLAHDSGAMNKDGSRQVEYFEIARVVTPYDITPPPRPDSCTWEFDVSDYEKMLHGQVTLNNYIETWINGDRGWLVTIDFACIQGDPDLEPIQVVNLWNNYGVEYGNPNHPIEDVLAPMTVPIDPMADAVKFRAVVTGHGQGNTGNCAEFCSRQHSIVANGVATSHYLWRTDCSQNPCSPQGGTWTYARAGWCPGSGVWPWDVDLTSYVVPGTDAVLDYNVQAYTNYCRPDNPDCVNGQTCTDCAYNGNGHTMPIYAVATQLISYRINPFSGVAQHPQGGSQPSLSVAPNAPNPFHPPTFIRYSLASAGDVQVVIHDAGGRIVRRITQSHDGPGSYALAWDGRTDLGTEAPSGVYFYEVRSGGASGARKMLLLRP